MTSTKSDQNQNILAANFDAKIKSCQKEIEDERKFLKIRTTSQQLREGAEKLVDTAYIEDEDGMPALKVVFDVHEFKPEEVLLQIEDGQLLMHAQGVDDREHATYRKTMNRKIDLPQNVDTKAMHCEYSIDGILSISMPFHMPPQKKPDGPGVVPVVLEDGRRKIKIRCLIGAEFTDEDIKVELHEKNLVVTGGYDAAIGSQASQTTRRELKKQFRIPNTVEVEEIQHFLHPSGYLYVDILLKEGDTYRCSMTAEDIDLHSVPTINGSFNTSV